MNATLNRPFVKKPALLCGDLVRFDVGSMHAERLGIVEALALCGGTVADVRMCDTGELLLDVDGQDITRVSE